MTTNATVSLADKTPNIGRKGESKGLRMEKSSRRGKIPQQDWPLIIARHEAGETLASIARTYDCSPPAISYIVSRNRDKPASEVAPPAAAEPQLIKSRAANGAAALPEPQVVPAAMPPAEVRAE